MERASLYAEEETPEEEEEARESAVLLLLGGVRPRTFISSTLMRQVRALLVVEPPPPPAAADDDDDDAEVKGFACARARSPEASPPPSESLWSSLKLSPVSGSSGMSFAYVEARTTGIGIFFRDDDDDDAVEDDGILCSRAKIVKSTTQTPSGQAWSENLCSAAHRESRSYANSPLSTRKMRT